LINYAQKECQTFYTGSSSRHYDIKTIAKRTDASLFTYLNGAIEYFLAVAYQLREVNVGYGIENSSAYHDPRNVYESRQIDKQT
jgi:hypothetical protein